MTKLTRVLGIAIVLIMLLGSIGNVAVAQQGTQTGASTQSGAQPGPAQAEPTLEPVVEEVVVEKPVVEQAAVQETVVVEEPVVETAAQVQAPAAQSQSQQAPANAQAAQAPVAQTPVTEVAPATTEQTITTSATNQTTASAQGGNQRPGTAPRPTPKPQAPPPPASKPPTGNGGGTITGPISVVVDLSQQTAYVYSGGKVIRSTLVNTGKSGFATPTGTFYINSKYRYDDMRGREGGESWDVRNVPYAMYFTNRGHALHGAPWAKSFGTPRSHGCVNLPMDFAAWLFNNAKVGTKVIVQR
ncbi:MAG: L,D-transpeptidase [Chloroflexia bacterium]|nr:L,D-transpeptidase [Chloroflexia bacterium]